MLSQICDQCSCIQHTTTSRWFNFLFLFLHLLRDFRSRFFLIENDIIFVTTNHRNGSHVESQNFQFYFIFILRKIKKYLFEDDRRFVLNCQCRDFRGVFLFFLRNAKNKNCCISAHFYSVHIWFNHIHGILFFYIGKYSSQPFIRFWLHFIHKQKMKKKKSNLFSTSASAVFS